MKSINLEFVKFLFFGLLNMGLSYLFYLLALQLMPYLLAYTLSYIAGILISYFLNSIFVFKTDLHWKKALQYPLVYLAQYLLGSITLGFFVEALALPPSIAALINTIFLVPISFILSRLILRRNPQKLS